MMDVLRHSSPIFRLGTFLCAMLWFFDNVSQVALSQTEPAKTVLTEASRGYAGKLVITRIAVTPSFGQAGEKTHALPAGSVLLVREERVVDGALYLQTLGGILRAGDTLPLDQAIARLTAELTIAEKAGKPLAPYYYLRGIVFHKQGEFERAVDEFTQAMSHEKPGNPTLLLARAESRVEADLTDEALEDCAEVLAAAPNSAPAHAVRGWIAYQRKNYAAALTDLNRAIELDPNAADAYLFRGWVHDVSGRYAEAERDLETCLKLDPLSSSARNSLGWLKAVCADATRRDPKAALTLARAACEWDAYRSYSYLDTLAAAYAANGDFDSAVKTQLAALKMCPPRERSELDARLLRYRERQPFVAQAIAIPTPPTSPTNP